jgi:hypothetical protein
MLQAVAVGLGEILPHLLPAPADAAAATAALPPPVIRPLPPAPDCLPSCSNLGPPLSPSPSQANTLAATASAVAPAAAQAVGSGGGSQMRAVRKGSTRRLGGASLSRGRSRRESEAAEAGAVAPGGSSGAGPPADAGAAPGDAPGSQFGALRSAEAWRALLRRPAAPAVAEAAQAAAAALMAEVLVHPHAADWATQGTLAGVPGLMCAPVAASRARGHQHASLVITSCELWRALAHGDVSTPLHAHVHY